MHKKSLISASLIILVTLIGCNSSTTKEINPEIQQIEEKALDQIKLNETEDEVYKRVTSQAVKAEFEQIDSGKWEDTIVFAEGKISNVDYTKEKNISSTFNLTQQEGNESKTYFIGNVLDSEGLKDGDLVKIYGIVDSKFFDDIPTRISATIIEKQ